MTKFASCRAGAALLLLVTQVVDPALSGAVADSNLPSAGATSVAVIGESPHPAQIRIAVGETFKVELSGQPDGDYQWKLQELDRSIAEPAGVMSYQANTDRPGSAGAGGVYSLAIRGVKAGKTTAVLVYGRSLEPGEAAKTFKAEITVDGKMPLAPSQSSRNLGEEAAGIAELSASGDLAGMSQKLDAFFDNARGMKDSYLRASPAMAAAAHVSATTRKGLRIAAVPSPIGSRRPSSKALTIGGGSFDGDGGNYLPVFPGGYQPGGYRPGGYQGGGFINPIAVGLGLTPLTVGLGLTLGFVAGVAGFAIGGLPGLVAGGLGGLTFGAILGGLASLPPAPPMPVQPTPTPKPTPPSKIQGLAMAAKYLDQYNNNADHV